MPVCKNLGRLEVENAEILYKNFTGEERQFNDAGDRNFCVVLSEEVMQDLAVDAGDGAEGWNVKYTKTRSEDPDDEPRPYLQVAIGFDRRPPIVFMIDEKTGNQKQLREENIHILDALDIVKADIVINPSCWTVGAKAGVKAYLNTLYATVRMDPFAHKYQQSED